MRRSRVRQAAASAALAVGGAACTLVTDLGGYTGGPGAAGTPFAEAGGAPVTGTDAAGGAADASPGTPDGAAGGGGGDARGAFCATAAPSALCADFDKAGATVLDGWMFRDQGGNNTVELDEMHFVSSPRGARLSSTKTSNCAFAQLTHQFPGTFHRAELDVDVQIDRVSSAYVGGIAIGGCGVYFTPFGDNPVLNRQDNGPGTNFFTKQLSTRVGAKEFHHVRLVFDIAPMPDAQIAIDGQDAAQLTGNAPGPPDCATSGDVWLGLGPHCLNEPGALAVTFDNVRFVVQ